MANSAAPETGSYVWVAQPNGSQQYTVNPFTGPLTSDPIYGFPAAYGVVQSVTGTFTVTNGGVTTETGTFTGSGREKIDMFRAALERGGLEATVRVARGREIDAACGQLSARPERKSKKSTASRTA